MEEPYLVEARTPIVAIAPIRRLVETTSARRTVQRATEVWSTSPSCRQHGGCWRYTRLLLNIPSTSACRGRWGLLWDWSSGGWGSLLKRLLWLYFWDFLRTPIIQPVASVVKVIERRVPGRGREHWWSRHVAHHPIWLCAERDVLEDIVARVVVVPELGALAVEAAGERYLGVVVVTDVWWGELGFVYFYSELEAVAEAVAAALDVCCLGMGVFLLGFCVFNWVVKF